MTDYDLPRDREDDRTSVSVRSDRPGRESDLSEDDTIDAWEMVPEMLTADDTVVIVPPQAGEFTCVHCFLVKSRTQLDHDTAAGPVCGDCAAEL